MREDTTIPFRNPALRDELSELVRSAAGGAQDGEHARQAAQTGSGRSEVDAARDMGPDTRAHAKEAFERFCATWEAKYPKTADCLAGDREELLAFYDFPAAHWLSLRTTNPIESTFATIRLRTAKTRNCLSEKTALSLVNQLVMSAE